MTILDVNGRPRSERTDEEELRILREDIERLPLAEQVALKEVYASLLEQESEPYKSLSAAEYKVAPVDIRTFLTEPYFLGETGASLWPRLTDDLVALFEGNYEEATLGGCLSMDSMVVGADGSLRTLEERCGQSRRVLTAQDDGTIIPSDAGVTISSGEKKVKKFTLANGMSLTLTPDHGVRVWNEGYRWVKAEDLKEKDLVIVIRKYKTEPTSFISKDEAMLMAYWVGDGSADDVIVPDAVCRASDDVVAAFINRLWACEGTVYASRKSKSPPRFTMGVASKRLVQQVQLLLFRFGVRSRIYPVDHKRNGKTSHCWMVTVSGIDNLKAFLDSVGEILGKEDACARVREYCSTRKSNTNVDMLPITWGWLNDFMVRNGIVRPNGNKWRKLATSRDCRVSRRLFSQWLEDYGDVPAVVELVSVFGEGVGFEPVKSVESVSAPIMTGDVTDVVHGHRFLGNGVSVRNSLGWGKSFFSTAAMTYVLYQMSCLRNPQRAYGIDIGSYIYVAMISVTEKVAKRVVINELIGKIRHSRYFQEHFPSNEAPSQLEVRFPDNIQVVAGSTTSTAMIGLNVFSGLVDEASFLGESKKLDRLGREVLVDQGEAIYKSIIRRMKSRFQRVGRLPGVLILASSKERPAAFIEKRVNQAREIDDPMVFVREYCLTGDTEIPLLDGTTKTMRELAEGYGESSFWVYSLDTRKKVVVPGRAHHPRLTMKQAEIVEVVLDDGSKVRATGSHPFMLRNGTYRRAENLVPGDSLMPLYRERDEKGYESVSQPGWDGRWQKTHHMVLRGRGVSWPRIGNDGFPTVVHHEDFNKENNVPDNLTPMEWTPHGKLHCDHMDVLLEYVKSEKHRRFSSENMRRLHQDEEFAKRRDERGGVHLRSLRHNEEVWGKRRRRSAEKIAEFYNSERGRELQAERSKKRWDKERRLTVDMITDGAKEGLSITEVGRRAGCTPSAVSAVLRRKGMPTYSSLKRSHGHKSSGGNHKVVSVARCGTEDVYDLSVDEYENFAVGAGVFVHNSTWDVQPAEKFSGKFFKVVVGNERIASRIIPDNDSDEEARYRDLGLQIVAVPEDYRNDFLADIDGALRDIAGVATDVISQYLNRTEKVYDSQDETLDNPIGYDDGGEELESWVPNTPLPIQWHRIATQYKRRVPGGYEEEAWRPKRHPQAVRYAHIDPSLTGDSSGITIAHIAGWTEVVRRDSRGEEYNELAPRIETDLVLQVIPPPGDEIMLADSRGVIYQFVEHGFHIGYVSLDSFQSVDTIQQLRKHGIEAEVVSVDKTTEPYDVLKAAMYEDRFRMQKHGIALQEFRTLQRVPHGKGKVKIDHPKRNPDGTPGSKDVADSIAGVVYSLTKRVPGRPMPPMMSTREGFDEQQDNSWVTDGRTLVKQAPKPKKVPSIAASTASNGRQSMSMPFVRG